MFLAPAVRAAEGLLTVDPSMLSGPLVFFASPGGLSFREPIPYGIANNITDQGWIWPNDNSGSLLVDFKKPIVLSRFRVFSTYNGAARGANWAIERSENRNDWIPVADFAFQTSLDAGVDDFGDPVSGFGGWYEIAFNEEALDARFWRIRQTQVLVGHAPRCGQMEFYGSEPGPRNAFLKTATPQDQRVPRTTPITIELEDGLVTQVDPANVLLSLNGALVTPVVNKPAGSATTTVSYTHPAKLPVGRNEYQIVFADTARPPIWRTNRLSFHALPDEFCPIVAAQLTGSLSFFASPAGLTHAEPIPYGIRNNNVDLGWIWMPDSYLDVDVGESTALARLRVYSSFGGAARGALWAVEVSPDGLSYESVAEFPYATRVGGGVDDDGVPRPDTAGWYEISFNQNGLKAGRFWRVRQTEVTLGHAPRTAEFEFYKPLPTPTVIQSGPSGDGQKGDAVIRLDIQDNLTSLAPGSLVLSLNGQTVSPSLDKPAGSLVTTVSYDPPGDLPPGVYRVRVQFTNEAVPPVPLSHEFTFRVAELPLAVCPAQLSGPLNFFASPAGLGFGSPIPYGIANNVSDNGWIWPSDNSGSLQVVLGVPAALNRFRVYSSFGGASRGANWAIEYSMNGESWVLATHFPFVTTLGGGINDDFTPRTDYGGWYEARFNESGRMIAPYWRVRQTEVLVGHAPRCAQVEFYGVPLEPLGVTPEMLSGSLSFFASPAGLDFRDPVPYGIANNVSDLGWIWPNDNSGHLQVDFGEPRVVNLFRIFSSYVGDRRGANWELAHSEDGESWVPSGEFSYETLRGKGLNDSGCARTDFGGWYSFSFNEDQVAARYWRIAQTQVIAGHAPRSAEVRFYAVPLEPVLRITFLAEPGKLTLSWVDPSDSVVLQTAERLEGPWLDDFSAFSPHVITPSPGQKYFRLRKPAP